MGGKRPLGIAALEDKIVRSAVSSRGTLWGALDAFHVGITGRKVNYVLDLDIRSFFDKVGHDRMEKLVACQSGFCGAGNSARSRLSVGSGRLKGGLRPRLGAPQGKLTHW